MNELPSNWRLARLGEVSSDIAYGFTTASTMGGNQPKLLRITDIQDGEVNWDTVPRCTDAPDDRVQLNAGDIVIARTGATTGKSYLISNVPERAVFASYLIRVRLGGQFEPRYAWAFMQSNDYWSQIQTVSKGTAQPGANASILSELSLPVPPLPEQRRIVAKIDSLTGKSRRARDHLDHIPRLVEKYKQAVLAAAFRGDLTREWRRSEPVSDDEEAADDRWPIPTEWTWRTVAEIGTVSLGRQRSPANHAGPNMRRYVRAANVTWSGWDFSDVKEMNFDERDFVRFQLKAGDVLVNEGSGSAKEVGKPAIWREEIADCCFQNTLIRVQPSGCTPEFLYWYFLFVARAERFVSSTQGVNIYHIGKDGLARFPIPQPPTEEQHEMVRLIEMAMSWIDRLAGEATSARRLIDHLDQSVLAKAFRGELVPQDPADEPASMLLERIRAERGTPPTAKRGRRTQ